MKNCRTGRVNPLLLESADFRDSLSANLESQPGLGSTFTIRLPVEIRPLDDEPPVPDIAVMEKPLRVLVVEDSKEDTDPDPDDGPLIKSLGNLEVLANEKGWKRTRKQFNTFLEEYLGELAESMESDDPERIRQSAHRFLGFFRMIEVRTMPDLLLGIQDADYQGDLQSAQTRWAEFQMMVEPFKNELKAMFKELRTRD